MNDNQSYIVKQRDPLDIVQLQDKGALSQFLKDPQTAVAGALIETFSHGPSAWTGPLVRVAVAALSGRALQQFAEEIKDFQEKGRIASDWAEKPKGYQTWVEVLRIVDEENPDEEKLDALKAMFFAVNRINAEDAERVFAYQLFQIAKRLNSNELLVMKTAYALFKEGHKVADNQRGGWRGFISERIGYSVDSLVHLAENKLVEMQLLHETASLRDKSAQGRLTDLGLKFSENLHQYHIDRIR